MPPLRIEPFSEHHLDGAASLLAKRHARHRAAEPLLSDADDFAARIADAGEGVVALDGREVVGYLLGKPWDDFGPDVAYVATAGHAASDAEVTRDMYAAVAPAWVDAGRVRHLAFVPASDARLLDAWFRLSFGQQHAYGVRETARGSAPATQHRIRDADVDDIEFLASLDLELGDHQRRAPTFSGWPPRTLDDLKAEIRDEFTWPGAAFFVAERADGPVAGMILTKTQRDFVPGDSIDLSFAATKPDARGSGAMLALTAHALSWANERGHRVMTTDWRVTNLLSSRFWPRRGFRPAFLRLYRHIP